METTPARHRLDADWQTSDIKRTGIRASWPFTIADPQLNSIPLKRHLCFEMSGPAGASILVCRCHMGSAALVDTPWLQSCSFVLLRRDPRTTATPLLYIVTSALLASAPPCLRSVSRHRRSPCRSRPPRGRLRGSRSSAPRSIATVRRCRPPRWRSQATEPS